MRAADALCEALKAEGVKHVFGIPGGASLPLYDALYDADFEHIQVRHEQCAGHAAEGYAKASGKVGVAFATSGPGATNLVTAIADAHMDSVPDRLHHRPGPHRPDRHRRLPGGRRHRDHAADRQALLPRHRSGPDPRLHPQGLPHRQERSARARSWSTSRRTSRAPTSTTSRSPGTPKLPGYQPTTEGNIKQIRIAAKAMANARRPILYVGRRRDQRRSASEELRELAAPTTSPSPAR